MSENERNDVHDSIERINQARWERSDAAWRPYEEKWAALIAARDAADDELCENEAAAGTLTAEEAGPVPDTLFHTIACEAARVAHEEDFESRWGLRVLEGVLDGYDVCVIYNNNPYARKLIRRDQELEEFRRWVADHPHQVAELAYAEYPNRGAGEGYSYALLIQCDPGWTGDVEEQYQAARARSWDDLSSLGDSGAAFGED
jgi:hypothetical protein